MAIITGKIDTSEFTDKYEKLVATIIFGDFLDIDTILQLMAQNDWTVEQVREELGNDIAEQYKEII